MKYSFSLLCPFMISFLYLAKFIRLFSCFCPFSLELQKVLVRFSLLYFICSFLNLKSYCLALPQLFISIFASVSLFICFPRNFSMSNSYLLLSNICIISEVAFCFSGSWRFPWPLDDALLPLADEPKSPFLVLFI